MFRECGEEHCLVKNLVPRILAIVAVSVMAFSLAGCSQKTEEQLAGTAQESSTRVSTVGDNADGGAVSASTETVSDTADSGETGGDNVGEDNPNGDPSFTYHLKKERKYDNLFSEDTPRQQLISCQYELLSLDQAVNPDNGKLCDEDNPAVARALEEINKDTVSQSGSFVETYKDEVTEYHNEARQDNQNFPYVYTEQNELEPIRADDRCLSVVRHHFTARDGAHGMDITSAYSFDPGTGKRLVISDVVTDEARLPEILTKTLKKQYPSVADYLWDKTEDDLIARFQTLLAGNGTEESGNDTGNVSWYVGYGKLHFIIDEYYLSFYAAGKFELTLSREDYPDLIRSYYLQSPEYYICPTELGKMSERDDTLPVIEPDYDYELSFTTVSGIDITYKGQSGKVTFDYTIPVPAAYYLVHSRNGDFLYLEIRYESNSEDLVVINLSSGCFETARFDQGCYETVMTDPDSLHLGCHQYLISFTLNQCWYSVGEGGIPAKNSRYYSVYNYTDDPLVLKQDAELNVPDSLESDNVHAETFPAGTKMTIVRSDNDETVDCLTEDGTIIRLIVHNGKDGQTIDDRYERDDLLDGVFEAG